MENLILFDYLSISTKIHDLAGIKEMLGLENVPWHNGKNGKWSKNRLFFNSISINLGSADGWIWFEMSGQGCRDFETYGNGNYEALFQLVIQNPGDMKITRLDVAYDDKMGIICMDKLCSDTRNSNFVSRFNDWEIREGSKGSSVCHGSMKSEIYLRIYDKAMERGFTDGRHFHAYIRCNSSRYSFVFFTTYVAVKRDNQAHTRRFWRMSMCTVYHCVY